MDLSSSCERNFRYCPRCGLQGFKLSDGCLDCEKCGFRFYLNAAAAVMAIILDSSQKILVAVRGREPAAGTWDLPGGFVDPGESAEQGLRREIKEEVGLTVDQLHYFCSEANWYEYRQVLYATADIAYTCEVEDFSDVEAGDDVYAVRIVHLDELKPDKFGLASGRRIISRFLASVRK